MTDAMTLTRMLGGKWSGRGGVACCPAHDDKSPSLSLATGSQGRLLLNCHAGCTYADIVAALRGNGLVTGAGHTSHSDPARERERKREEQAHAAKRARQAATLWDQAEPVTGTVAERYLRNRGITCPLPDTLRYVGDCWHPSAKRSPALLGKVTGAVSFAVHRTYVTGCGRSKANVTPQKAMLGTTLGGAVRLAEGRGRLVVAEGIETALSLCSGLLNGSNAVWAALSANGMKALHLPERPGRLTIAPDGDAVGRGAANDLAERAHGLGWQVTLLPAPEGRDWNDVLTGKAVRA